MPDACASSAVATTQWSVVSPTMSTALICLSLNQSANPAPESSNPSNPEYAALFEDVLAYARESVHVPGEAQSRTRIRWWAALGLLRALASSPQAAAATLRERAGTEGETDEAVIERLGRELVFDPEESAEGMLDITPGAQVDAEHSETTRRLLALAGRADALAGGKDRKLALLTAQVQELVGAGLAPIVFCRFIATAEAVAEHLRGVLKGVEVAAVTGRLIVPRLLRW